jgi:hypothetical protein
MFLEVNKFAFFLPLIFEPLFIFLVDKYFIDSCLNGEEIENV